MIRHQATWLLAGSRGAATRTSATMRMIVAVSLVVILLVGLAVASRWRPPARTSDLYPLRWQTATTLPAQSAGFVFAQSSPNVGYACTTTATLAAQVTTTPPAPQRKSTSTPENVSTSAVYRTQDGGMSWKPLTSPFAAGRACRVFAAPHDANELFVAEPSTTTDESGLLPRVWRSLEGGSSWQALGQIVQPGEHDSFAALVPVGSQLVAEVTSIGVPAHATQLYRSTDDGKTWQLLPTSFALAGLYAAGTTLYAHAPNTNATTDSVPATTYRSTDAGETWTAVMPPFANISDLAFVGASDGADIYGVGVIPAATAYGAYAHAVIVSKDGGATWTRVDAPPTVGALSAWILPDGTLLAQSQLQATQPTGGFTSEIFRLRPGQSAWQLIGIGPYVSDWQVTRGAAVSSRLRLWAVAPSPSNPRRVVWADLPG